MRKLANEELNRKSVDEFKDSAKTPIVIVLDNVRSLNNVGSVFRTGDAFLIEAVYLCGITGQPPHKEIQKTALGATESVAWKYFENTIDAVHALIADGYLVYAIEQAESAIMLNNFMPAKRQKIAIIFGNEVKGVQQEVIDASTDVIEIPQVGTKHSLNIAVSVGIVMWDLYLKIK
ncbi:MAG: TrmH family tRNA/rRNA methyltransferase [Bacteroidetes bacterium]|nr:TrmH family tRNA/rRNA methyltransferase [Bacteroidota bacterium]